MTNLPKQINIEYFQTLSQIIRRSRSKTSTHISGQCVEIISIPIINEGSTCPG